MISTKTLVAAGKVIKARLHAKAVANEAAKKIVIAKYAALGKRIRKGLAS